MSTPWQPVVYPIGGGVNTEITELSLKPGQAPMSINFLHERGGIRTAPADWHLYGDYTIYGGYVEHFKTFNRGAYDSYTLNIISDGSVVREIGGASQAALTGVSPVFDEPAYHNINIVNGVFILGNVPLGALRHDPSGTTMSTISAAKYRFFTGLAARLVGANRIEAGNLKPREVGWSVGGDETDWASAGSGTTNLAESPDEITGLFSVQNTLVILRRNGITLGVPTRQSNPAFQFEIAIRNGIGNAYPALATEFNNVVYFTSKFNVHAFSLDRGVVNIGDEIRRLLFATLLNNGQYRMFVSVGDVAFLDNEVTLDGFVPKLRLHIAPEQGRPDLPHFVYDLEDNIWTIHRHSMPISAAGVAGFVTGAAWGLSQYSEAVQFHDTDGARTLWYDNLPIGQPTAGTSSPFNKYMTVDHVYQGPPMVVNNPAEEYSFHRLLLTWRFEDRPIAGSYESGVGGVTDFDPQDPTSYPPITLTVRTKNSYTIKETSRALHIHSLVEPNTGWYRSWFELQNRGQLPEVTIAVPPEVKLFIRDLIFYVSESGTSPATTTNPAPLPEA